MNGNTDGRANFLVTILTIGFSLWAGVIGFATYLVIQRIDSVEAVVSEGVLPLARQRIESLERQQLSMQMQYAYHLEMYYEHLSEFNRLDARNEE